jgi:predicted dithiol-disulfide oxidoreductase (DUF899 family)
MLWAATGQMPWPAATRASSSWKVATAGPRSMGRPCVFVRRGDEVFRTYFTGGCGLDQLGATFSFAGLTPYGRRETWEDSPHGWPQDPTHSWERLNDEYDQPVNPT